MKHPSPTTTRPNHHRLSLFALVTLLSGGLSPAPAQTAPIATDDRKDEILTLSPFVVTSSSDVGFAASSSMAGGRIATPLKDTPVAYSVITAEFIEAFNLTDVTEAAAFTTNSARDNQDNTYKAFGTTSATTVKLRGQNVTSTRNFFPYAITPDSFNIERYDFARGPNAVLFGAGGIGGTANSVSKQALPDKKIAEVSLQLGSYEKIRLTADYNLPFADKKGAVRINLLKQRNNTWRQNEWQEKQGLALAASYKITPNLSVRIEAEYLRSKEAVSTTSLRDKMSAWDGHTVFSGIPVAPGLADPLTAVQREAAGVNSLQVMRWVTQAGFPANTLLNFGGTYTTKAARQSTTSPSYINGVAVNTVGLNLDNTSMADDPFNIPGRWAAATSGSSFVVPTRSTTTLWSSKVPIYEETGKDIAAYLDYNVGNFFIQIAADYNKGDKIGNTALRRGLMDVYMDINQKLPDGSTNPNFLHPYSEFMEYRNIRNDEIKNVRAQAVYMRDFDRGWLNGRMSFSLMGGKDTEKGFARAKTLLLPITAATFGTGTGATTVAGLDGRTWVDNIEYSLFGIYTRLYLDQANKDYAPASDQTALTVNVPGVGNQQVTPKWMYDTRRVDNNRDTLREYKYFQTAANLDLFKNHLVLIGAFRRDYSKTADYRVVLPGDMPAGWDGTTLKFRDPAPADFFSLMYTPKNSAGVQTGVPTSAATRPRVNNASTGFANLAQPQYLGDRFQDDYDSPVLTPTIDTWTYGAVYNIKSWVGAYANVARTFSLPSPQTKLDGSLFPSTASEGKDYGIRFSLPGGKLAVSLGRYTSYQANSANNIGQLPFRGYYNAIYNVAPVGDTSPFSRNNRNVAVLPENIYDSRTTDISGYELEVTAHLRSNWRLILNAGSQDPIQTNVNPDMIAYFGTADATARAIMGDAGILIDSANVASLAPQYVNTNQVNINNVNAAIIAWNTLYGTYIPANSVTTPTQIPNTSKYVGNIATDYRFETGKLKGLRVGVAMNYRGRSVVGFRASDTIVSPSNPALAIDDPTVDGTSPVYAPSFKTMKATFSYTMKLKHNRTLKFDLFIDNLLDTQDLVYSNQFSGQSNTYNVPRTDISSPARVGSVGAFSYIAPRSYSFSTKLSF